MLDLMNQPRTVSAVRDLQTGEVFVGRTEDAQHTHVSELHPLLEGRARVQRQLVRMLRDVCLSRANARLGAPDLLQPVQIHLQQVDECLLTIGFVPPVLSMDALVQARRLAASVAQLESELGRRLLNVDWQQMEDSIACHPEVVALSEALESRSAESVEAFHVLELHVEALDYEGAVPRCVHCAFVTEGVGLSPEQRAAELRAVLKVSC